VKPWFAGLGLVVVLVASCANAMRLSECFLFMVERDASTDRCNMY